MNRAAPFLALYLTVLVFPATAQAYMGPSLGLGVIGTLLTVIVVLLLSLFAFVIVPLRRMLKKMKQKTAEENSDL